MTVKFVSGDVTDKDVSILYFSNDANPESDGEFLTLTTHDPSRFKINYIFSQLYSSHIKLYFRTEATLTVSQIVHHQFVRVIREETGVDTKLLLSDIIVTFTEPRRLWGLKT